MPAPFATLFALGAIWGVGIAVADSKPTLPLRLWVVKKYGEQSLLLAFLECPACQSFWYGLIAGFFIFHLGFTSLAFAFLSFGFSYCMMCWTQGARS